MQVQSESRRSHGEGMATYCSILAWTIPQTEKPGRLQFMGSQRVRHDGVSTASLCCHSKLLSKLRVGLFPVSHWGIFLLLLVSFFGRFTRQSIFLDYLLHVSCFIGSVQMVSPVSLSLAHSSVPGSRLLDPKSM